MQFKSILGSSCLVLVIVICLSSVQCAPSNSTDTTMASKDKASSPSSSTPKAPGSSAAPGAPSSTVAPKDGSKNKTASGSAEEDCEPEAEPETPAGSKNKTEGAAGKREGKQLNLGDKKDSYAAPEPEPETKATAGKTNAQPGGAPEKLSANNATTAAPAAGGSSAVTTPMALVCLSAFTTAFFVSAGAL